MGAAFRNFQRLRFAEGVKIKDCMFEDCRDVTLEDENAVSGCTFRRVDTVFITSGIILKSEFRELECNKGLIISMENSDIRDCRFQDIELSDEAYLCESIGYCSIELCEFTNIQTDRRDRKIINGQKISGILFKRLWTQKPAPEWMKRVV